ncbi:unnamed protein product [Caretta caretta]
MVWGPGVSLATPAQASAQGGDTIVQKSGDVMAVQWSAGTWMVEYGRGFIPPSLIFVLSDTIFSTQDVVTLFSTFRICAKAFLVEASAYFSQLAQLYQKGNGQEHFCPRVQVCQCAHGQRRGSHDQESIMLSIRKFFYKKRGSPTPRKATKQAASKIDTIA